MKTLVSNTQRRALYLFFAFILPVATTWANEEDPFADDTQDVPAAPIDDFIIPVLMVALGIAFYLLQKQIKNNRNLENKLNQ